MINQDPKDGQITNQDQKVTNNDNTTAGDDTIGENADNAAIKKGDEPNVQDNPDGPRVTTVTPDNDSGDPGPSTEQPSSNKGQGPSGENL